MRARTGTGAAAVLAGAALVLTACGGSGGGSSGSSGTGKPGSTKTSTATTSPTSKPATAAVSTVKGRAHDAGVIVSARKAGGLIVLVLNRYTVKGMSDAKLAADGAPLSPHSDVRFTDQNKGKTYLVPVNPSAPIVINTCTPSPTKGGPPTMTSTPVTLAAFLASANRAKRVVLLSYDDSGRLVRLDTDPVC